MVKICHALALHHVVNNMLEIIKKCNNNEYLLTQDRMWVRNFYKQASPNVSINNLINKNECELFIKNETKNKKTKFMELPDDQRENVIIISDGYNFKEKHKIIANIPDDKKICVIAVNKSLNLWELVSNNCKNKKAISYYVINNPYPESEVFLPKNNYYPKCISSIRTSPEFVSNYKGPIYAYTPSQEKNYSGIFKNSLVLDDYRNPICAAISFTKILKTKRILLMCCDNSFKENKPGSIAIEDGMFCYPQQNIVKNIIDAKLYWSKKQEIKTGYFSFGEKIDNAEYISSEQGVLDFFME